ncbi:hypothetical protein WME76_06915 [Sorangium sp. So ce119]|uniref:hypothetical protein n=1 Tax=Sorangium sp. So ce119 TaxID=3133279 RepID=UPI003F62D05A
MHQDRIDAAMSFPMEHVASKYASRMDVSIEVARGIVEELRRYLLLLATHGAENYNIPAGDVDDMWHIFLLFSADYRAFCDRLGAGFIDHAPLPDEEIDSPRVQSNYRRLLLDYEATFGEKPPRHIWPTPR